jgi:hypothetical protein
MGQAYRAIAVLFKKALQSNATFSYCFYIVATVLTALCQARCARAIWMAAWFTVGLHDERHSEGAMVDNESVRFGGVAQQVTLSLPPELPGQRGQRPAPTPPNRTLSMRFAACARGMSMC